MRRNLTRYYGVTGTVALEQFPRLLHGRGRCRDGQRMGCVLKMKIRPPAA